VIRLWFPHKLIRLTSQNATQRAHWNKSYKKRKSWSAAVFVALVQATGKRFLQPPPKVRATIVRIYGGQSKEMDLANLVGGCKELVDSLTQYGVIMDDRPRNFDCKYSQRRAEKGEECGVLVTVEAWEASGEQR